MISDFKIDLTGDKELINTLKRMKHNTAVLSLKKALRKSGSKIKKSVKSEAPVHTGNLRKSITVYDNRGNAKGALIRVGAAQKIAPHAILVEFGTEGNRTGEGLPTVVKVSDDKFFTLKHTGKMPANNFFERGYDKSRDLAVDTFKTEILKEINKATK